jgi:uncharacterized protein (TIRG00374 family)
MKPPPLLRRVLALAVLGAAALCLYLNREQLSSLGRLQPGAVLLLLLATSLFFVTIGLTFALLVGLLSVKLRTTEWLGLTSLNTAMNYLGPLRPGAVVKAVYLKQEKRLPYSRFSAVLAANGFLLLFCSGVTGLVVLGLERWRGRRPELFLALACLGAMGVALLPFLCRVRGLRRKGRVWDVLRSALEGFQEIRSHPRRLALIGLLMVCQYLCSALANLIAYRSLGLEMDFLTALFIGVFTSLSNFFTLTPNNVGLQEMVMAYLYSATGQGFSGGLVGAGLVRAAHLVVAFAGVPFFMPRLMGRSSRRSPALESERPPQQVR